MAAGQLNGRLPGDIRGTIWWTTRGQAGQRRFGYCVFLSDDLQALQTTNGSILKRPRHYLGVETELYGANSHKKWGMWYKGVIEGMEMF